MKRLFFGLLLTFASVLAHASDPLDGYVVMANKDTVKCTFKSGGFFRSVSFQRIAITTIEGAEQVFKAHDKKIIGFGFREKGRQYDFLYVDTKPKSESGFYQRVVNGAKYQLYVHTVVSQGYPGISTGQPQYVLFTPTGAFQKFETCILCPWKKQLTQLLQDDQHALDVLAGTSRLEIVNFALQINKSEPK